MRRQLVPVVRLTVIKAKTRPGIEAMQLHDAGTAKYLESFVFTNRGLVASLDLSRVFLCIN